MFRGMGQLPIRHPLEEGERGRVFRVGRSRLSENRRRAGHADRKHTEEFHKGNDDMAAEA